MSNMLKILSVYVIQYLPYIPPVVLVMHDYMSILYHTLVLCLPVRGAAAHTPPNKM